MLRNRAILRLAYACSTGLLGLVAASPAIAQQASAEAAVTSEDMIIVTGSRIVGRDYEANSPIVTVGDDLLRNTGSASLETSLNRLPAFTPAQNPQLGGDTQATATNTPGAATVSLRSLGTNRNLVLVDGRRATPANALGVVDINTIPAAAIERVEIITGGASATYGADAVGGVVNFILKRNFEGFAFDAQGGISERGDGAQYAVNGLIGANFADGSGNVTLGVSKSVRRAARQDERPWYRDAWRDPRFAGTQIFSDFSGFQPSGGINPTQASYDALFGPGVVAAGSRLYFNPDGTAFTGFFNSPLGGSFRFNQDVTNGRHKRTQDGGLAQNFQDAQAQLPLSRYNVYGRASYDINDWIGVFTQATFTRSNARTVNEPSPTVNGWSGFARGDAPVPAELRAVLDSRIIPTNVSQATLDRLNCGDVDPATFGQVGSGASCDWQLTYLLDFANRISTTDVKTYNLVAGLEGEIPGTDWTWELYTSKGESDVNTLLTGVASLSRFREVINAPNWGAGFRAQGNQGSGFGGFGASVATCTSGFNPFDYNQVVSQDCIEAISADLKTRSIMEQSVYELNMQGGLLELPAGQLRAAIGATHRVNDYVYTNDTLSTQGRSFQDQAVGLYPSGNSAGTIKVSEVYGELLIPVLSEMPLIEMFELNLGARYSDYNTTGGNFTWKAMADWEVTDWLRLRGGYNKAVRAPNIAELFLAPQQTFTAAGGGDVCRTPNTLGWSVNPATNPNAANVLATCRILMNQQVAETADVFYSSPVFHLATGPAFAFPILVGNPNVRPESAKTWTVGAVVDSPFTSEALSRLRLTVDYYNIRVDDAIGPLTLDTAQRLCFDPTFNPAIATNPVAAAATPQCQAIDRVAGTGALGAVQVTYLNNGRFRTQGIDLQLDWSAPVGPGELSLNSVFNYLITFKSAPLPPEAGAAGQLVEYAGTLGPSGNAGVAENGLNPGAFRWKLFSTLGYSVGPAEVSLQWQHLPSAKSISFPSTPNTPFVGSPAYNLFNLNSSFRVNDMVTIRAGVENLFDKAPPLSDYNAVTTTGLATNIGTSPINAYFFDVIGRRYFVGASVRF
ncbi:TonB-dependent receptor plug domain-containing protein [Alteraurantiacibacter lauratis]|uniref:TonB-dependent receptor domain-containing protein n=1 Tax=Alteraurantiacibacter lauratis TaxID=2054627 RepID=A0ABV7EHM9_9SPHN